MDKKSKRRSCCPVACTLDILGDKWTLLVIRDLFLGRSHFREFIASPEKIATNILADRLNRLVNHRLVERRPSPEQEGREAYYLTDRGKSLGPVLEAVVTWGLDNLPGTQAKLKRKS